MLPETEKSLYLPPDLMLENDFWFFSLKVWQQPAARELLLECQDRFSLRVSLLLYGAWLAREGRILLSGLLTADSRLCVWQTEMVDRLRFCRTQLSGTGEAVLRMKNCLQSAELQAEQLEMSWLFHKREILSKMAGIPEDIAVLGNLINYTKVEMGVSEPQHLPEAVQRLLSGLTVTLQA